jgi:hypothetical protein
MPIEVNNCGTCNYAKPEKPPGNFIEAILKKFFMPKSGEDRCWCTLDKKEYLKSHRCVQGKWEVETVKKSPRRTIRGALDD